MVCDADAMPAAPTGATRPSAARLVRDRARSELVAAITAAGARQLAEVGPAALSLRAVARDLGLASSALYRYFPSRDALLTALIVEAYDELGAVAEQADATAEQAGADPGARWLAVCRAVRGWARAHPHGFALLYGSPVPGYRAPQETVAPAVRLSRVMAGVVAAAAADGSLVVPGRPLPGPPLVTDTVLEVLLETGRAVPVAPYGDAVERSLVLLVALVGALTYELFGHLVGATRDDGAFFDRAMAVAAEGVGLRLPLD